MTIQRQYSLPNCTLTLQGLGEGGGFAMQTETRPLMSILMSAECYIVGHEKSLRGGREFFENLVATVSHYAQEFFSTIESQEPDRHRASIVHLQNLGQGLHQLTVRPQPGDEMVTPVQINLTTVQLFDLVEAIDQFFADAQTLPALVPQLTPLPKRLTINREPAAKRALPAALGISGLAVAAVASFYLPVPEVKPPQPSPNAVESGSTPTPGASKPPQPQQAGTSPSPQASPTEKPESTKPDDPNAAATAGNVPEISDLAVIGTLRQKLYNQIDQSWKVNPDFKQALEYRVSVNQEGQIVGYKPLNDAALNNADKTPLPSLRKIPTGESPQPPAAIAQFKVVFTSAGELDISSWKGFAAAPAAAPEITEPAQLKTLNRALYKQINEKWQTKPEFPKELIYRVEVDENGVLAHYEPVNQPAYDYVQDIPLPELVKAVSPENPKGTAPRKGLFKVVFQPNGVLQVSPWRGYR
ncbi:hypothetical protein BST81_14525 [Leptolyngbya sp. 'hensonii']|uniref:DUF4335 domain-containing protein n=1 Tax=Leptolyngbya sp. 'hensonii' TaxID=1922337 RepID=UPI00094F7296|nr:DUF4335 domain-containing protein [Leptolyngbya sp. 'hensonii']OLP17546.1 hypothetical protein BST81_14525 [Leptolyngbya sp. 'hensonii']